MNPQQSASPGTNQSLLSGVMAIAKNFAGLLFNRLELAALEFSEVRANFAKLCILFALGIVAIWFALAYWSVLVVALTWETLGWKILLILALLFTFLGLGLFMYARSMVKQGKLSMSTTIAELRNDRDALR
jgi:uncharacterized membrane protein YqjE